MATVAATGGDRRPGVVEREADPDEDRERGEAVPQHRRAVVGQLQRPRAPGDRPGQHEDDERDGERQQRRQRLEEDRRGSAAPCACTTASAPPSITVCTKRPRWVRSAGGRSQSATESATSTATVPPPMSSARRQVIRTPATHSASSAKAGTIAGGPPKSLPSPGVPSTTRQPSPIAATATAALPRRPAATRRSAAAVGGEQAAGREEREARVGEAVEPARDNRLHAHQARDRPDATR